MKEICLEIEEPRIVDKYFRIRRICGNVLFANLDSKDFLHDDGYIIDEEGKQIVPGKHRGIMESNGEEFVIGEYGRKGTVIDKTGEQVLPDSYWGVILMGNGLYAALLFNNYRIIDKTGKPVFDYSFKSVRSIGRNLVVCTLYNDESIVFDNGVEIARFTNGTIENIEGRDDRFKFRYKDDEYEVCKRKCIIVDKTLKQVVPGKYFDVIGADNDVYSVFSDEIDNAVDDGSGFIKFDPKYKLIKEDGTEIDLHIGHKKVTPLGSGLFAYDAGGSTNVVVDIEGKQVFPGINLGVRRLDGVLFGIRHLAKFRHSENYALHNRDFKQIKSDSEDPCLLGSKLYGVGTHPVHVINEKGEAVKGFFVYSQTIKFNGEEKKITADTLEELDKKLRVELTSIKENLDSLNATLEEYTQESETEKAPLKHTL